jgi:hypothetical protein
MRSFVNLIERRVKKSVATVASSSNIENEPMLPAPAPVAAVMGMMSNPVAYNAPNLTNVIESDSFSDESSVSTPYPDTAVPSVLSTAYASSVLTAPSEDPAPLTVYWRCSVSGPATEFPVIFEALMDHEADTVFISESFASELALKCRRLYKTMSVEMAMPGEAGKQVIHMSQWVKLRLNDPSGVLKLRTMRAVIAPSLCSPVILGLPFLSCNKIVVDHDARTAIVKDCGFDLLHPTTPDQKPPPKKKLKEIFRDLQDDRKLMLAELKMVCAECKCNLNHHLETVKEVDKIAAIRTRIETLAAQEQLIKLGDAVKGKYKDVFLPIPHLDELPTDVYCRIKLKDALKTFTTRSYSTPRKYKDAWATLIQQHLDAGRIRPSNSAHTSPTFIVPKVDRTVLPLPIHYQG